MGIVTLRLNEKEEQVLETLQKYLDEDKSKIFKNALYEKYEEIRDREIIDIFEKKLKKNKVKFERADSLIEKLENKYKS